MVLLGMVKDALKFCGTHFNPGRPVQCVMPELCLQLCKLNPVGCVSWSADNSMSPVLTPHLTTTG